MELVKPSNHLIFCNPLLLLLSIFPIIRVISTESFSSVQFSHSVMSDYLRPHGLQHTRLPCPSLTPRACSKSCPLSQWWHPTISASVVLFSCLQVFLSEKTLCNRCPKYWSFSLSISPSSEYSGLIFFVMDWLDLLALQGTLKSHLHTQIKQSAI